MSERASEHRGRLALRHYVGAFVALLLLSGLTLGLSVFVRLGPLEVPVALAIAGAKACLVVAVFMHLVEQRKSNALLLVVGVFFTATLVGLIVTDVATRDPGLTVPTGSQDRPPALRPVER